RFRAALVKDVIHGILQEELSGKNYDAQEAISWTKVITDTIKLRLKELNFDRYKIIVQVLIGEQRGQGVQMGCRCFWDSDTDNYAQDIFINESFFCIAAAYGIFTY
ncbi:uncharacterized protein TRIADDRAFT_18983, partial [Trichoplax adhaerens]